MSTTTRTSSIVYVDDTTALVTKAFAKKAVIFGTPEFKLWREYKAEFPLATMTTKRIARKPGKAVDTRNMTYANMAGYIRTLDDSEARMIEFELVCKRSKVQTNPYRSVLAWFIQTFEGFDSYKAYFAGVAEKQAEEDNIFRLEIVSAPKAVNE